MSLVSCLPALEDVHINCCSLMDHEDLGCLLEALALCPRLRALGLNMYMPDADEGDEDLYWPFPATALAKLSSLTSLALDFNEGFYTLDDVVGALVSLTGLVELSITLTMYADMHLVPAALGQLKALRSLEFGCIRPCVFEAGVFRPARLAEPRLPVLRASQDAEVLPGVSALQCLTGIEFSHGLGPLTLDPQLAQLPGLQRLVLSQRVASSRRCSGALSGCQLTWAH